ncbi:hypothetical protein QFZ99_006101 [Paraburkholderia atlantica]|uniref:hypothetical protein n=1 Tax=Paraburkholderia atlantica TaxID=2654982 RepID=UPI003D19B74D
MIGYLIDRFARTVREVTTDGTLADIYALMDCTHIEAINPADAGGDLLLDENGKLKRHGQASSSVLAGRSIRSRARRSGPAATMRSSPIRP